MKMKKQLLALLLAAVIVLSLTGCKETLKKVAQKVTGHSEEVQEEDTTRWAEATADPLIIQGIADASAKYATARLEHIVKHLDIPTSLKEFGVPAEDLEGLVNAGMQVQRLLVNNMRPVTADDARKLYQEIM